jgi:hypothetical protein
MSLQAFFMQCQEYRSIEKNKKHLLASREKPPGHQKLLI